MPVFETKSMIGLPDGRYVTGLAGILLII